MPFRLALAETVEDQHIGAAIEFRQKRTCHIGKGRWIETTPLRPRTERLRDNLRHAGANMLDLDIAAAFIRIALAVLEKARHAQPCLPRPMRYASQKLVHRHILCGQDGCKCRFMAHASAPSFDSRSMPVMSASAARIAIYCDTAFDQVEASSQPAILSAT